MTDLTAGQAVMPYLYRGKPDLLVLNARIMEARIAAGRPLVSEPRKRGMPPGHGTQARAVWDRRRGHKPCASCLQAETLAHKMQVERRQGR